MGMDGYIKYIHTISLTNLTGRIIYRFSSPLKCHYKRLRDAEVLTTATMRKNISDST